MDPAEHVLLRRLRQAVQAYSKSLQDQPVLTKALTAGILAGLGDLTVQCVLWSRKRSAKTGSQWKSVTSVTLFGLVVSGPGMHYLQQALESLSPRSTHVSVLKKVAVDRLVFTPPYLFIFFFFVALLEGRGVSVAWRRAWDVLWGALLWNWVLWAPAQYINMSYIPLKYRVLFMNAVSFVWNLYTALIRRK